MAIDGSKFTAVNNRDRNFTAAKKKRRMARIEESVARYLDRQYYVTSEENGLGHAIWREAGPMTTQRSKWFLAGLLYLVLWPTHASTQDRAWQSYIDAADEAHAEGDYAEARKQFDRSVKTADAFGWRKANRRICRKTECR